ncbi:MAG: hypothetical protein KZQ94_03655 [Candidatus Thiodiazotropha sp. (ex Troendleina suluensis)]|nr:hypothetical protein [Candidatus Thiodiazotropha sp. (ex Troendleina suluensis)]
MLIVNLKTNLKLRVLLLIALFIIPVITVYGHHHCGGKIIAVHDVNILSSSIAGAEEAQFILDTLRFLVGPTPGNILAIQSAVPPLPGFGSSPDSLRDYSTIIVNALANAGYTVDYTRDTTYTLTQLQNYDAVIVGVLFPEGTMIDASALTAYINDGGNIYVYGGVSVDSSESATLNGLLTNFGLEFTNVYNMLIGDLPVVSTHTIFNNVSSLEAGNGINLNDLDTNPFASIIGYSSGQPIFAAYSPHCPTIQSTSIPTTSIYGILIAILILFGITRTQIV